MISISLCMIVKNESAILRRCLDSFRPIADEIVIIDTGSTDNTKEIAAKYTDKLYDYHWTDNFADARNFAFSKSGCDYIYSCDADEILDETNQKRFLQLKETLLAEIEIVQMYYVNDMKLNTVYNANKEYRPKLFKRIRSFQWISPIHETVKLEPIVFDSDIEILHCPLNSHTQRDFSTFIKAVQRNETFENYVVTMFCKELFISGTDEDFLSVQNIFIEVLAKENRPLDVQQSISCVLARIYRLSDNLHEFMKITLKDMAGGSPCAEICMELGYYFFHKKDYEEAVLWFINAASETSSILDIHTSGNLPLSMLANCYEQLAIQARKAGDYDLYTTFTYNAKEYNHQADEWKLPDQLD